MYKFAEDVTKNDAADNILDDAGVACHSRAIVVGTTGVIAFINGNGNPSKFTAVAGVIYPIQTKRILSTDTTAVGISALW